MYYDPPERNPGKPLLWIIIDSLIIAMIAFLAALPAHLPTIADLYVALKGFFISFFVQLVVEKGVKPYSDKGKRKKRR